MRRIAQVPWISAASIPDRFEAACRLDYQQLYRNLGYIAVMHPGRS
jgi:hypoxanthine-guanine phosphoribosyltransferase